MSKDKLKQAKPSTDGEGHVEPMVSPLLEAMMNGLSQQWQRERAKSQITLGKFITMLEKMPSDKMIDRINYPHSYRGYYDDLAFEKRPGKMKVATALKICQRVMGNIFEGYKGGEFMMGESTPVWIASYGNCGERLMGINENGGLLTANEEWD